MDFEQRLSREMLKIASWPRGPLQDADALLDHLLLTPAASWRRRASCWPGRRRTSPGSTWRTGRAAASSGRGRLRSPTPKPSRRSCAAASPWTGRPPGRCAGRCVQGRLFALDRPDSAGDSLVLGEIVAQRVAAELDQFYLTHQLRTAAVTDERVRLACDLHDGMLQSLTGTALQLQALAKWMEKDPPAPPADLREILREIQQLHRRRPAGPPLLHRGAEAGAARPRRPGGSRQPAGGAGGPAEAPLGARRRDPPRGARRAASRRLSSASSTGWCANPCSTSPATPRRPSCGSRSSGASAP